MIAELWTAFSTLSGAAVVLGILVTQAVKVYDKDVLLKRDMSKRETILVSAITGMVVFLALFIVYSWWVNIPMRNEAWAKRAIGNAILSGVGPVALVWAGKKAGLDIDEMLGDGTPEVKVG